MSVAVLFKIFSTCVSLVLVNGQSTQSFIEGRIVGGTTVKMKYYPHSVYLEASCDDSEWHCGSSVLNQKILLTAAHCVFGCEGDWAINAFAGHEIIKEMKLYRKISRYVIHPKYDRTSFINDISLLHMSKHLPFGPNIKRVIIRRRFPNDKDLQIAGWGTVLENPETRATRLKAVKQKLMSRSDCKKAYVDLIHGVRTDGMLCAKNNIKNRPSQSVVRYKSASYDYDPERSAIIFYSGDSGGALMTSSGTQVGLVSFRPQRAPEIIIYTNVTFYYQWIKSNAKLLYCN